MLTQSESLPLLPDPRRIQRSGIKSSVCDHPELLHSLLSQNATLLQCKTFLQDKQNVVMHRTRPV